MDLFGAVGLFKTDAKLLMLILFSVVNLPADRSLGLSFVLLGYKIDGLFDSELTSCRSQLVGENLNKIFFIIQ
jgi:hypothetical protein